MGGYIHFTHKHKGFKYIKWWASDEDVMRNQMEEVGEVDDIHFYLFTVKGDHRFLRHGGKTIDVAGKLEHWDMFFEKLLSLFGKNVDLSVLSKWTECDWIFQRIEEK